MGKRKFSTAVSILLMSVTMSLFTNCSQGEHSSEATSQGKMSDADFFEYSYSVKPDFFGQLDLLKPVNQLSNAMHVIALSNTPMSENLSPILATAPSLAPVAADVGAATIPPVIETVTSFEIN